MAISFNEIPANLRNPQTIIEIDNSRAITGLNLQPYVGLLIGQKTSGGSQTADTIELVTDEQDAISKAGQGSVLHLMAKAWFENNQFTTLFLGAIADPAGAAQERELTVTGTATGAGTVYLYINNELIQTAVAIGDDPTDIAAAMETAINANADLPFTASATLGVVTLTAKNFGLLAADIDMRFNYDSANQSFPAGVSAVIAESVAGSGIPALAGIITAMADEKYNIISMPYLDSTSYNDFEQELDRRYTALTDAAGQNVTAKRDTISNLVTFGGTQNSKHFSVIGEFGTLTSMFELGAANAAVAAFNGEIDPARPFQTLGLAGIGAPTTADDFTASERETLMNNGIATIKYVVGDAQVNRMITMYQVGASGAIDVSYLDIQTLLTLDFLRFDFKTYWSNRYPRHKLADDGTNFAQGQAIVTPSVGKTEAINRFQLWEQVGLVENIDQFKTDLIVERNLSDRNRLDFLMVPDLINQLRVTAVQIAFIL